MAQNGVTTVLLNRPQKHNALSIPMWEELIDCFDSISRDPTVRVAILGATKGPAFCAGMDLGVFQEMKELAAAEPCAGRVREQLLAQIQYFQRGVSAPELCSKPVIAAVDGSVIGGGVDLLTACDMRYCTARATFSVKEVDLAIVADVGTMQRLPHLVGDARARELTYTGRAIGGEEAESYGLVQGSFRCREELYEYVRALAGQIAAKSPLTVRGIKQVALYTRDHPTDDALGHVAQRNASTLYSDDLDEAFGAFAAKRAPTYPD